ncbi:MAG: glycosyltransferase [Jejuia sp.]
MRVLQLIDSLNAGGAERLTVNYANALSSELELSCLCCTRHEGPLKEKINSNVGYLFLKKRNTIDILAIIRLLKYLRKKRIQIIHAHATSFFLASIIKIVRPEIKIIWHDHFGKSEFINHRKKSIIKLCSPLFSQVIVVNHILKKWCLKHLRVSKVTFLPNFAVQDSLNGSTKLKGVNGKRIIHLANLRPQKDHNTLIRAFIMVQKHCNDWTLHCVGKDFYDGYSRKIKHDIRDYGLENKVIFYGSKSDIGNILGQANIGVLSSKSEGLPLALLEYAIAGLPVVATKVGDVPLIISNEQEGVLVEPEHAKLLSEALIRLIKSSELQKQLSSKLNKKVLKNFSEVKVIQQLLGVYKGVLA